MLHFVSLTGKQTRKANFAECNFQIFLFQDLLDPTVQNEKELVNNLKNFKQLSQKVLVVDDIKRWYWSCRCDCRRDYTPRNPAVKGVSFTVGEQECFGLLGLNGAGKSTIFSCLTGTITPSHGKAYLRSISVTNCATSQRVSLK